MPAPPRRRAANELALHEAALLLRRAGHRVYRAGLYHSTLDGRRVTNKIVLKNADFDRTK